MFESPTLSKLTTEIASHLGKELDEPFKRILADKIDSWRSRLLRNSLQEKPLESKFFHQTVYVPLSLQDPVPCLSTPLCRVLRSVQPLPKPLRYGNQVFDYVGSIDGTIAFSEAATGTDLYRRAGKYSKKTVFFQIVNDMLDIINGDGLPMVRVDGVFDKPSAAMRFNCEVAGVGCDYWDQPYPVTGDISQLIVQSILQIDYNRPSTPSNKEIDVNPQLQDHEPDGR